MAVLRFLIVPHLAAALLLMSAGVYPVAVVNAAQEAHSKKPAAQFHYVCPMHEDVTSKTQGTCRKCKMKLVRKPLPPKSSPQS